jgi:hypothetical protein
MAKNPNRGIILLIVFVVAAMVIAYWFNFLGGKALYNQIMGFT